MWVARAWFFAGQVRQLPGREAGGILVQAPRVTPGILPSALRASLRLFKIAPGDFVCPSCGARRRAETAALLVDNVLPQQPVRQWVLSLPFALRYLLATRPEVLTQVLAIVYRAISAHLIRKAGLTRASAVTGAVTLIQRCGLGALVGAFVRTDEVRGRSTRILVGSALGAVGAFLVSTVACRQEDDSNPAFLCGVDGMVETAPVIIAAAAGGTVGALTGRPVESPQMIRLIAGPEGGIGVVVRATVPWHSR